MKKQIDKQIIDEIVSTGVVNWQKHALQRMMEREISRAEVKNSIFFGKIIEFYKDDRPYPSALIAHINDEKSLHVVVAVDVENRICYIITAYVPDGNYFEEDMITRRS